MLTSDNRGPSNRQHIKAASIGNIAFDSLSEDQDASVFARTSRGIFIRTSTRWLNYISLEPFRGPLTITLPDSDISFSHLNKGMHVQISSKQVIFPDANLVISAQRSSLWKPSFPNAPASPVCNRQARLIESSEIVIKKRGETGLAPLLSNLLDLPSPHHLSKNDLSPLYEAIIHLQEHLITNQTLPSARSITDLLGQGSGLTPSSDDFVIGFLLALNRWYPLLLPAQSLQRLNRHVVDAAYEKTTTLSANLIECATLGLADERLIEALDWLVVGTPQDSQTIEHLLTWGSSSGVDVFVGYVTATSSPWESS
jgi:hypothetical protein